MWTAVGPIDVDSPAPSARSKHSATLVGEYVYLLGGRNGNLPLKDFWRYNLISGKWYQLKPTGDKLPCLQEHSAIAYKDNIYIFGGEVGFSAGTETPLWNYDIKNNTWRKLRSKKGVATPKGRRGHSALVHRGSMLIYGGYQDLRGSCSELWAFHFETESWHLLSTSPGRGANADAFPPPRHKHSAVLHEDAMWVYGGMTDLQERGDFWKFDTRSKTWTALKSKLSPGPLHSHAVCKLPSSMLVFGGEKAGHPVSELWKFHFSTESWEKLLVAGVKPQPRSESIAFAVSELLLSDPNSLEARAVRVRSRTCLSADRGSRHSSYLPNNRVAPCEKTYVFQPSQANYTDGSADLAQQYSEAGKTRSFLQEISKISQINIAKLNNKCTYTVLTGCTTDSTESLLKQHASPPEFEHQQLQLEMATPTRMVKSKSAYVIKKKEAVTGFDSNSNSNSNSNSRAVLEKIPREPISVPNFTVLTLPQPVLTPVEASKLVYLDTDDENDLISDIPPGEGIIQVKETLFKPVKREESYSSHLGYADNPLYQHMINSSTAVKFSSQPGEENVSSTSDYASIETMNRLSSASNYSVKTPQEENLRNKEKDGPFGFCNPNYFGPDIKAIIESGDKKSANSNKLHNSEEELLELQDMNGVINKNTKVYYSRYSTVRNRGVNNKQEGNQAQQQRPKEVKCRALSASRVERREKGRDEEVSSFDRVIDPFVPLYVYIIGGKEQGQVTVFQRPISIWKLKLF